MARFQAGSFTLHTTDLNSGSIISIGGVTQMGVHTNAQTISDDSGEPYDEAISLVSEIVDASFTTQAIDAMLTYVGLAGYCILSDGSHPGARLYGRILGDCKSPPASTDNLRYTFGTGLIYLGHLSARRGANVTLTVMIKPITDGTNAPIAFASSSITLPTTSALSKNLFTIGACKVGSIVLTDFESLDLQFGVSLSASTPMMGSVWSDSIAIRKIQPIAAFTGFDPRILNDSSGIPLLGKQASHATTLLQFKKRAGYSSFVADGASQHVTATMNGMALVTDIFTGSGNGEATTAIVVKGSHDGTNVPILFNLANTYTASP